MGRASKNRGPIGLNAGRLQETARSAGERKAPCSLAPWQLPPKVSAAGDVPTRTTHQRNHTSQRTTVDVRARLQEIGEPIHGTRPPRQADHTTTILVR